MFMKNLGEYENLSVGMRVKIIKLPQTSPITVYSLGTVTGQGYYSKLWQAKGDDGLIYEVSDIVGFIPDVLPLYIPTPISQPTTPVSIPVYTPPISNTTQILGMDWYIPVVGAVGLILLAKR